MFKPLLRPIAAFLLSFGALAAQADAHFLWLSIRPAPVSGATGEASRDLHGHFSEGRFDDTAPFLNKTLQKAELSMAGAPLEWKLAMSGAGCEVGEDATLVSGHMLYGLFGRGGGASKLLYYDAKAAWDLEAASQVVGLDVEVVASRDGDELVLKVLHDGQPAAGSEVVVEQDGTLYGQNLETGEDGTVRLPFPASPVFACRARVLGDAAGEYEGKPYKGVMRYSTLCIERLNTFHCPEGSDVEAALMVSEACLRTAALPAGVSGLKGDVTAVISGKRSKISFVQLSGHLEVFEAADLAGDDLSWARSAVEQALGGVAPMGWSARGPIQFTGEKPGPMGTPISVDESGTTVLLKEHEVREIRSHAAGMSHVRTMLEFMESDSGHLLPIVESHASFAAEGSLAASTSVQRTYTQVGEAHVPESVREITVGSSASTVRELQFGPLELVR